MCDFFFWNNEKKAWQKPNEDIVYQVRYDEHHTNGLFKKSFYLVPKSDLRNRFVVRFLFFDVYIFRCLLLLLYSLLLREIYITTWYFMCHFIKIFRSNQVQVELSFDTTITIEGVQQKRGKNEQLFHVHAAEFLST